MNLVDTLAIEEAKAIISGWNGKDEKFMVNGEVYTEDDVQCACELLEELEVEK